VLDIKPLRRHLRELKKKKKGENIEGHA